MTRSVPEWIAKHDDEAILIGCDPMTLVSEAQREVA